MLDELARL